jgi:hypothetical protein
MKYGQNDDTGFLLGKEHRIRKAPYMHTICAFAGSAGVALLREVPQRPPRLEIRHQDLSAVLRTTELRPQNHDALRGETPSAGSFLEALVQRGLELVPRSTSFGMRSVISEPAIEFIALRCGQRYRCAVGGDAVIPPARYAPPRQDDLFPGISATRSWEANVHRPSPAPKELRSDPNDRRRYRLAVDCSIFPPPPDLHSISPFYQLRPRQNALGLGKSLRNSRNTTALRP